MSNGHDFPALQFNLVHLIIRTTNIYLSLKKTLSLSLFPPPLASRRLAMQPTATSNRTWPPTIQLWLTSDQVRPPQLYVVAMRPQATTFGHLMLEPAIG